MLNARPHAKRLVPAGILVAGILLLLLLFAGSSSAHTHLESSDPADKAHVESVPDEVTLTFGGKVNAAPGTIKVFDPTGEPVSVGDPKSTGAVVTQNIDSTRNGEYAISYRVVSEDSHTVSGFTSFTVGTGGSSDGEQAAKQASRQSKPIRIFFGIGRALVLLSLLGVAGGGMFCMIVAPEWKLRGISWMLPLLVISTAATFVADAALASGVSLSKVLDREHLRFELSNSYGKSMVAIAIFSVIATLLLATRRSGHRPSAFGRFLTVLLFAALAACMSFSGHAVATDNQFIRLPLDMLHMVAAGFWIGGLLQLRIRASDAAQYVDAVKRFSSLALVCVLTLLATGIYAALVQMDMSLNSLTDTQYGRLVLAKLFLFAATMPMAALNKSTLVPALENRPDDAPQLLRRYVYRELFILIAILGMTAALIGTTPPLHSR